MDDRVNQAIAAYAKISSEIDRLTTEMLRTIKPLAADLVRLEEYIDKALPPGQAKLATPAGIAERRLMESVSVSDWMGFIHAATRRAILACDLPLTPAQVEILVSQIHDLGPTRFCKRDVKKLECFEHQAVHGALPDGLTLYSRYKLSITPTKEKGYLANE